MTRDRPEPQVVLTTTRLIDVLADIPNWPTDLKPNGVAEFANSLHEWYRMRCRGAAGAAFVNADTQTRHEIAVFDQWAARVSAGSIRLSPDPPWVILAPCS